jgi:hypothetical protein
MEILFGATYCAARVQAGYISRSEGRQPGYKEICISL